MAGRYRKHDFNVLKEEGDTIIFKNVTAQSIINSCRYFQESTGIIFEFKVCTKREKNQVIIERTT